MYIPGKAETFSYKPIYEAKNKALIFDRSAAFKYKIYKRIRWYENNKTTHDSWEIYTSYGTIGEAERDYNKIPDVVTERDFDEWYHMIYGDDEI